MPHAAERDHGVAGKHWLLDEELAPRRKKATRRPLPVLLRHDDELPPVAARAEPPREAARGRRPFPASLLALLVVYLLLRAADLGGALETPFSHSGADGRIIVTAMLGGEHATSAEGAVEVAALRSLLGEVAQRDHGKAARSSTSARKPSRREPRSSTAIEELVPPIQPPAPLPIADPSSVLPPPQLSKTVEDLERATGLEPATLSLEG